MLNLKKNVARLWWTISWVPTMGISHIEKFSEHSSSPRAPHSLKLLLEIPLHFFLSTRCPLDLTQAVLLTASCPTVCKSSMCFQSWALMNIYGIIHPAVKHTMAPFCIVKRSEILCTEGQYWCLVSLVAIKKMCAVKFSGVGLQGLIHKA